jgi:hypothetical protein
MPHGRLDGGTPPRSRRALGESRLEGGYRRNLKIINFERALYPGLGLEINNSEFGVRKIVLLAMSCSINAYNFGSQLKIQYEQENFRERERR